jgi:hypothetical protein
MWFKWQCDQFGTCVQSQAEMGIMDFVLGNVYEDRDEGLTSDRSEWSEPSSYRSNSNSDLDHLRVAPLEQGPPSAVVLSNTTRIHAAVRANFDEMEAATARLQEIEDRLSCLPDGLLDELVLRRKRAAAGLSQAESTPRPEGRQTAQVP